MRRDQDRGAEASLTGSRSGYRPRSSTWTHPCSSRGTSSSRTTYRRSSRRRCSSRRNPESFSSTTRSGNDGGLTLGAALELFVFVQYRRDVVLPIERNHAAASACEPTRGCRTRNAEVLKDPWVARSAHDFSDPMVIATTASGELRHASVSGTLGFAELPRPRWARAISSLITGVSQLQTSFFEMSADLVS